MSPSDLATYGEAVGLSLRLEAATALARTLSVAPWWAGVEPCALVVGPPTEPGLWVLGALSAENESRLVAQARACRRGVRRLRYLPMPEIERAVDELAGRLQAAIPPERLATYRFTAIPRGGWIVLGMLAYALGLTTEQLLEPRDPHGPTLVVDDRAISGVRFRQWLRTSPSTEIVFAHLASPAELRREIELCEPRVRFCVAARDLEVLQGDREAPAEGAAPPDALRQAQYWWGATGHLCFPWSEPQRLIRGDGAGEPEAAWRLMPAALCLGNRSSTTGIPVCVPHSNGGAWQAAPGVIEAELEGRVVLGDRETGGVLELSESAGVFWQALTHAADRESALEHVRRLYPDAPVDVAEDLDRFASQLVVRRLLRVAAGA